MMRNDKKVYIEFIKYGLVGIVGTISHTLTLYFGVEELGLDPLLSSSLGFITSVIISFLMNTKWTFNSKRPNKKSFIKYLLVCLIGLSINLTILYFFTYIIIYNYLIGQVIALFIVPIINFSLNKKWAFSVKQLK